MKRNLALAQMLALIPLLIPAGVRAAPVVSDVLISEIQTGSTVAASEEFIELYNASDQDIDISQWKVEYFSASAATFNTPTRSITLHGTFYSHAYYLITSNGYLADKSNDSYSASLAKAGGHVRVISSDTTDNTKTIVHDLVGWGTALHPEGLPAPAPAEGTSIERKVDTDNKFIDTDNNADDFAVQTTPNPESTNTTPSVSEPPDNTPVTDPTPPPETTTEPPAPDPTPPDSNQNSGQTTPSPTTTTTSDLDPVVTPPTQNLLPIELSELMPNPASPATDSQDEYVELYNPNDQAVDLTGYKIQTGNTFNYSYAFTAESIPGKTYRAYYVTQTGVLLANAGGKARLIDASGNVIVTTTYETADEGEAWANVGGQWVWTLAPTPYAPNILLLKPEKVVAAKKASTSTKKTATTASTKKSSSGSAKVVKASATKPKTTAKTAKVLGTQDGSDGETETAPSPIHPGILAAIAAAALAYILYEYRDDIKNRVYQFNRYRADRRTNRQKTPRG